MSSESIVQNARPTRRDERGASLSAFVATGMTALFLVAGLVVDGGAQVRAHRQAEVVAARAVRSGTDASAAERLAGHDGTGQAVAAAQAVLADEGVGGEATMAAGRLTVTTRTTCTTTFLQLLGVHHLDASGSATGELRRV